MKHQRFDWQAWVAKAGHDRLCIANNLRSADVPWDTVCFHAQQYAEKVLKAWLVAHGCEVRRTHDLVALLSACVAGDPSLAHLEEDCRRLNAYAAEVRYPEELAEPGREEGLDAVSVADRIGAVVLARLSADGAPRRG